MVWCGGWVRWVRDQTYWPQNHIPHHPHISQPTYTQKLCPWQILPFRRMQINLPRLPQGVCRTDRKTILHPYKEHKTAWYTSPNKNPSAWYFVHPAQAVTWGTVAIIIRVVLLSPYLRIRGVSLSSIHYNKSQRVYINRRQQYICLIWN